MSVWEPDKDPVVAFAVAAVTVAPVNPAPSSRRTHTRAFAADPVTYTRIVPSASIRNARATPE